MNTKSLHEEFKAEKDTILAELADMARRISELSPISLGDLTPSSTVIVTVDINNGFAVEGTLCSPQAAALIEPTAAFLGECKARGFTVVSYCDRHSENSTELNYFPAHCVVATAEGELPQSIAQHCDKVIYKNSTNGHHSADLSKLYPDAKTFVISGVLTDMCVCQLALTLRTALNEINSTAEVIVDARLTDTYNAPGHNRTLKNIIHISDMMTHGIKVVSEVTK